MNKIDSLFEYVHFRIYKFFKGQGDNISEFSATLVLSIIQCFTLLDVVVIIRLFYAFPLPKKIFVVPAILIVGILNWYRYERNLDPARLKALWEKEERENHVRNGWLIGLYLAISILIPIVHGYLEHNLKVI